MKPRPTENHRQEIAELRHGLELLVAATEYVQEAYLCTFGMLYAPVSDIRATKLYDGEARNAPRPHDYEQARRLSADNVEWHGTWPGVLRDVQAALDSWWSAWDHTKTSLKKLPSDLVDDPSLQIRKTKILHWLLRISEWLEHTRSEHWNRPLNLFSWMYFSTTDFGSL